MVNDVRKILEASYGVEITDKLLDSYREIEENFILKKWKPSELDSGHFVESVRRILEFEFSSIYTPYNQSLSKFTDSVLKQYENFSGHESFRLLIPRALKSIYNIRNKRGVGHTASISPNEMDATYILHTVKWVLAEIVRLKTNLSIERTQELVQQISQRNIDLIWKNGEVKRILNPKIPAKNQVLILLFDTSPQRIDLMRSIVEYKHANNFRNLIVGDLHKKRLIEWDKENGECRISPTGLIEAEKLIIKYGNLLN